MYRIYKKHFIRVHFIGTYSIYQFGKKIYTIRINILIRAFQRHWLVPEILKR